jgi:hypothetical protein
LKFSNLSPNQMYSVTTLKMFEARDASENIT